MAETISIANLPTGTPSTDDILVFVDRADGVTKRADIDELPGGGSGDMLKSENLSGLADYAVARTNLGLQDLATLDTVGTAQIDNDAVTFAKVQNINTNRILGRSTAGTGDVEELNVTAIPSLIGLGTSDSPQFTGVNVGHATDTTITRVSGGVIAVEGVRIKTTTPLVVSATSYTTDTGTSLNMDNLDMFIVTAQAGSLLFNAPSGTLVQGRQLIIRIKDNGTSRALTYNAVFRSVGATLPTATVLSKTTYIGLIYNSTDTKWDCVAVATEA